MTKKKIDISDNSLDVIQTTFEGAGSENYTEDEYKMKKEEILSVSQRKTRLRRKRRVAVGA
ncbi:MAG: hypothetical protein RR827_03810, partial [Oscillospiraceae bacterium]